MKTMTKSMNLSELKKLIAPAEKMSKYVFDPRTGEENLVLSKGNKLQFRVGSKEFLLTADAYYRLGQMVGIPKSYITKSPVRLIVPHINYWLEQSGLAQLSCWVGDNTIELFTRGTSSPISNDTVIESIYKAYKKKHLEVFHISHDLFSTNYSIVNEEIDTEIKVGDIVRTGIAVENSYAMIKPLTLSVYTHRLVCSNGSISTDNVFRFIHRGADGGDEANEWVDKAVEDAIELSNKEVAKMHKLAGIKFDGHLSDALISIYDEMAVPLKIRKQITDEVIDSGVDNMYDLFNIVTKVASNSKEAMEDADSSYRLMRVGGSLLNHPNFCPSCHRICMN